MRSAIFLNIIVLIMAVTIQPAIAQHEYPEPDELDIYDPESGAFLQEDYTVYLYAAGEAYDAGDFELSAQYYLTYLRNDRTNETAIYNLACCYGLLGEAEFAAHYLLVSFMYGFDDTELMEVDPDFDSVRDEEVFVEAVESIKEFMAGMQPDVDRLFLSSESYTPCYIRTPDEPGLPEPDTLVVALHDNFGTALGFSGVYDQFHSPDFIWAGPQGPYAIAYGDAEFYNWDAWGMDQEELPSDVMTMTTGNIVSAIRDLKTELGVDRVYLLGFGTGAEYAYRAGLANPEMIDGIIAFWADLDTDYISDSILAAGNEIPVFIVQPSEMECDAREVLESYGYSVLYYEFEGEPCEEEDVFGIIQEWMKVH